MKVNGMLYIKCDRHSAQIIAQVIKPDVLS